MKVVVASLFGDGFEESLTEEFPELDFVFAASEEDQAAEIKDADVFMGSPSRNVFLASDRLRWLHCPGTGIDKLTGSFGRHDGVLVAIGVRDMRG